MASKTIGELQAIAGDFKPLPVGEYPVEVTGVNFVQKDGKNPYFKLEFTVTQGPYLRRKLWTNLVLGESEGSAGYFFSKMAILGLGTEYWAERATAGLADVAPDVSARLIGSNVTVAVKVKEYPVGSGQLKNEVDKILASGTNTVYNAPDFQHPLAVAPSLPAGI